MKLGIMKDIVPKIMKIEKSDEKESYADINGIFIGTMICEPFDEERAE